MSDTTGTSIGGAHSPGGGRRRRRRRWLWPVLAVAVLAAAVGVFFMVQDSRAVSVLSISPAPDSILNSLPVSISCELSRYKPGRGTVTLTVDGAPVPAAELALRAELVQSRLDLADGPHTVAVAYDAGGLFSRHVARTWNFTIDRAAPTVSVLSPSSFPRLSARSSAVVFALSEPGTASLTLDGASVRVDSGAVGSLKVKATLVADEGKHALGLTVTDRAGNTTMQQWDLTADHKAPAMTAEGLSDAAVWNDLNSAAVALTVSDTFVDQVTVAAILDGAPLTVLEPSAASGGTRKFGFETGTMPEGTHSLEVSATDLGGHTVTMKRDFLVDTSAVFGARTLKTGAEGEDVKQLQRILKIKGAYAGEPTGLLDEATAVAAAAFNTQHGLSGGQVVTEQTLKYLLGYVRIDVSERTLSVYGGDDQLIKTYRVAVGMAAHPTPIGNFRIINKAKNPTWNPPDSAWAAGMGPVPPGPGNPLGTRWMGLNSPGIGIHGTPAPSSIGTAASHGCIRMKIPEAEDLFDRVFVGTPVEIVK